MLLMPLSCGAPRPRGGEVQPCGPLLGEPWALEHSTALKLQEKKMPGTNVTTHPRRVGVALQRPRVCTTSPLRSPPQWTPSSERQDDHHRTHRARRREPYRVRVVQAKVRLQPEAPRVPQEHLAESPLKPHHGLVHAEVVIRVVQLKSLSASYRPRDATHRERSEKRRSSRPILGSRQSA